MRKFIGVIRAPFLLLTPVCVFVGVATAVASGMPVIWGNLVIVMIAAIAAHISVNALNEYLDFKSGLDLNTVKTPFSGGSGILPMYPDYAVTALAISIGGLLLSTACGFYLFYVSGWGLLPLGLLGVFTVVAYTPWINRNAIFCLFAPGVGFGMVMVLGTHYALTTTLTEMVVWASLLPLLLVSNLLLLNQFPDVDADRQVGRRHLPILIGRPASGLVYASLLLLSYIAVVLGVLLNRLPALSLLVLLTSPLAIVLSIKVRHFAEQPLKLIPWMGLNVVLVLVTPVLLGLGLWFGAA